MRKWLIALVAVLCFSGRMPAQQFTTVTAAVVDSAGTPYISGTYSITLVNSTGQQALLGSNANFQQNFSGGLSTTGFFSVNLASVTQLFPLGMQWSFNICANPQAVAFQFPAVSVPCFTYTSTGTQISGTSVDLSSSMTPVATVIPRTPTTTSNNNFTGNTTFGPGSLTVSGTGTAKVWNNVVNATQFTGTDIFAQANAAAASLTAPGQVTVPPGSYGSVTTTLNCVSGITFYMQGVTVTYTGTGKAINIQNTFRCILYGPTQLLGPKTSGTVGIYLGSPTNGSGLTTHNELHDILIGTTCALSGTNGFGIGVQVDGNTNAGTYWNKLDNIRSCGNLNQGWLWLPHASGTANQNNCLSCSGNSNGGNGWQIDGAGLNTFPGWDSEGNGGCGLSMPGTLITGFNMVGPGGDSEQNTGGDLCGPVSANAGNVFYNVIGPALQLASSTRVSGVWQTGATLANRIDSGATTWQGNFYFGCGGVATPSTQYCFKVEDEVNGGALLGLINNGSGSYTWTLGTSHAPISIAGQTTFANSDLFLAGSSSGTVGVNAAANAASGTMLMPNPVNSPATIVQTVASGSVAMPTSAVGAGACVATSAQTATGVATTDTVTWAYNATPAANPGELVVVWSVQSGTVTAEYCNPSAGSITPNAATLNWRVVR